MCRVAAGRPRLVRGGRRRSGPRQERLRVATARHLLTATTRPRSHQGRLTTSQRETLHHAPEAVAVVPNRSAGRLDPTAVSRMCDRGSTFETPCFHVVPRGLGGPSGCPLKFLLVFSVYSLTRCNMTYRVFGMTGQIRTSPIRPASAGAPRRRLLSSMGSASGGPAQTLGWGGGSPPRAAIESGLRPLHEQAGRSGREWPPHAGRGEGRAYRRSGAPCTKRAGAGSHTPLLQARGIAHHRKGNSTKGGELP